MQNMQLDFFGAAAPQAALQMPMPQKAGRKIPEPESLPEFKKKYSIIKANNPEKLVLVRYESFYLLYDEDALRVASILGLHTIIAKEHFFRKLVLALDCDKQLKRLTKAGWQIIIQDDILKQ